MKKANDTKTVEALEQIILYIKSKHSGIQLIVEDSIADELSTSARHNILVTDRGESTCAMSRESEKALTLIGFCSFTCKRE
jgi:hypothetical protein